APRYRSQKQLKDLAAHFQPMLLRFRADLAGRIAMADPPESPRSHGHAQEMVSLLFADDAELCARVLPLLAEQEDALHRSQLSGVTAVVVEALLALFHQQKTEVMVGEVAKNASAILLGRGENYDLEARAVGSALDDLGIDREARKAPGIPLRLSHEVGRHIHELARTYRVPHRNSGCRFCDEQFGEQQGNAADGNAGSHHRQQRN